MLKSDLSQWTGKAQTQDGCPGVDAARMLHALRVQEDFSGRSIHPMFHHHELNLLGYDETEPGMWACTGVPGSHQGMQATVTWGKSP